MNRQRRDRNDGFISPTPEPGRHDWFRPMASLPELMGALRQGGSQVSLEKRPDLGHVVVRDGQVVAAAAMRIHLSKDLREWMVSTGLWP